MDLSSLLQADDFSPIPVDGNSEQGFNPIKANLTFKNLNLKSLIWHHIEYYMKSHIRDGNIYDSLSGKDYYFY